MSGETSGLRNRPWNAVPATASAAPTITAASTRGPRTCSTTFSTAAGAALGRAGDAGEQHIGKLGERHRIAPDGEGDDEPERQHAKRDDEAGEEAASHLLEP